MSSALTDADQDAGLRDELAAWLMACDECIGNDAPEDYLDHERSFLRRLRGNVHSGDCTKESHSCVRCQCDAYLANADALMRGPLATLRAHATAAEDKLRDREAEIERLKIAFHDAIRRPLGVTPDSGAEFYDPRMADEAETRRAASNRSRHRYRPNRKYPWFCEDCGYPEHEVLKHLQLGEAPR